MIYPISRFTLFPFIQFFVKRTTGFEHLPASGPYILACKHTGPLDGEFIGAALVPRINRKIHFISNVNKWGWFWENIIAVRWAGCIPYNRHDRRKCLLTAREHLEQGKIVGIFPSGVLDDLESLREYKGKTGVARLALWTKVPVIPVGIHNFYTKKKHVMVLKHLRHPKTMMIRIGEPMTFPDEYGKPITYELLKSVTENIVKRIEELSTF